MGQQLYHLFVSLFLQETVTSEVLYSCTSPADVGELNMEHFSSPMMQKIDEEPSRSRYSIRTEERSTYAIVIAYIVFHASR